MILPNQSINNNHFHRKILKRMIRQLRINNQNNKQSQIILI